MQQNKRFQVCGKHLAKSLLRSGFDMLTEPIIWSIKTWFDESGVEELQWHVPSSDLNRIPLAE